MKYFLSAIALLFFIFMLVVIGNKDDFKVPQEDVTIDLKIRIDEE
ncbi:MAG: hypothetical protein ACJAW3_000707 [Lentimonas sp.]|jgi:hypothetical protein